jgi:hypothetical protein
MPTLVGPVRSRILINPKLYPPFVDFCCGKDRLEEREVNQTVCRIYGGAAEAQWIAVILERPGEKDVGGHPSLVGVCGVMTGALDGVPGVDAGSEGGYIGAFGTDMRYRKHLLDDGKTRPGNALMRAALEAIQAMFGGEPMSYVFAKVKRTNSASRRLFDEHGFEDMGNPQGEHVLLRAPGIKPGFKRRPTWSQKP